MTTYRVEVTDLAADSIEHYTQYIQQQSGSVEVGLRWAGRVYSAIDTLQTMPRRYGFAPEQVYVDYELRALIIGDYLALYHVDDLSMTVRVLGFRHGARLPRTDDLPDQPPLS